MSYKFSLILFLTLGVVSCSNELVDLSIPESFTSRVPPVSGKFLYNVETVNHTISIDDAISYLTQFSLCEKMGEIKDCRAVIEDGDSLLYIANFNKGWAIVSAILFTDNTLLAYNDTGSFDPENISNPGVALWYETTKKSIHGLIKQRKNIQVPSPKRFIPDYSLDYYWVRLSLPSIVTSESTQVNHLLSTQWGQSSPWNSFCPNFLVNNAPVRAPTGCVAVAMAQILYNLHFAVGKPDALVHYATPSYVSHYGSLGWYYTISSIAGFYTSDSSRWNAMPLTKNGSNTDYVSDFMAEIGYTVGMNYYVDQAIAPISRESFINYNVQCDSLAYNYDVVKSNLDNDRPVLITAFQSNSEIGHAWIIDGYSEYHSVVDQPYKWVMLPPDSLSYYNLNYDYVLTEEQKQIYYPEIEENEEVHDYSYYNNCYLLMNWGYDDNDTVLAYNDGHYSIVCNWNVGGATFNTAPVIYCNFQ